MRRTVNLVRPRCLPFVTPYNFITRINRGQRRYITNARRLVPDPAATRPFQSFFIRPFRIGHIGLAA